MTAEKKPVLAIVSPLLAGLGPRWADDFEIVDAAAYPSREALAAARPDVAALLAIGGEPLATGFVESLPNLKLIACFGAGYDGVDVAHAKARGIAVTNCPSVNNEDVADVAIGLMIALVRDIVGGHGRVLGGGWTHESRGGLRPSLRQLRCGILGFGAIGRSIAARLPGFGISSIAWHGPNAKPDAGPPRAETVLDLARDSDVLFVACRADESTKRIVSAEVIEALGPKGYLVNVSRGSTVDEDALIAALKAKRLAGAALDVFEQEPTPPERWRDVPNVVLTPHIAGAGYGAAAAQIALVGENLKAFARGLPLVTPV